MVQSAAFVCVRAQIQALSSEGWSLWAGPLSSWCLCVITEKVKCHPSPGSTEGGDTVGKSMLGLSADRWERSVTVTPKGALNPSTLS